jgi:hypothetical protein
MITACNEIYSFFTTNSVFSTALQTKLYPAVAPEGTNFPFATYQVDRVEAKSKDKDDHMVTLFLRFDKNKFTEMAQLMEDILPIIKNKYDWEGSTFDFIEDDMGYVGIINFLI